MGGHRKAQRPGAGAKAAGSKGPARPPASGRSISDEDRQQAILLNIEALANPKVGASGKCADLSTLIQLLEGCSRSFWSRVAATTALIPTIVSQMIETNAMSMQLGGCTALVSLLHLDMAAEVYKAGAVNHLLRMLGASLDSKVIALHLIVELAQQEPRALSDVASYDGLPTIIASIKPPLGTSFDERKWLTLVLKLIVTLASVECHRRVVFKAHGIPALVTQLSPMCGSDPKNLTRAAEALGFMAQMSSPGFCADVYVAEMLACDALPSLVSLLGAPDSEGQVDLEVPGHALNALIEILKTLDLCCSLVSEKHGGQDPEQLLAYRAIIKKSVFVDAIPLLVQLLKKNYLSTSAQPCFHTCIMAIDLLGMLTAEGTDEYHTTKATELGAGGVLISMLSMSGSQCPHQMTAVVRCLANLALNKENQTLFGMRGVLRMLIKMLDPNVCGENLWTLQREVLRGIYVLTSDADNQVRAWGGQRVVVQGLGKFLWADTQAGTDIQRFAAGALRNIASSTSVDVRQAVTPALPALMDALKASLADGAWPVGEQVAGALRNLMLPDTELDSKTKAAQAGMVELLFEFLVKSKAGLETACSNDKAIIEQGQAQALGVLRNLLIRQAFRDRVASRHGFLGDTPFIDLLNSDSIVVQEQAAGALKNLLMMDKAAARPSLFSSICAVAPLVKLLGSRTVGVQVEAAGALRSLSLLLPLQLDIPARGAIAPLIRLLGSSSAEAQEHAAGALWALAFSRPKNKEAMIEAGAMDALSKLLMTDLSDCEEVREQAEGAHQLLLDYCGSGPAAAG